MHSPAKFEHTDAIGALFSLLRVYVTKHGLGRVFTEKATIHLSRNSYEPDIAFFLAKAK